MAAADVPNDAALNQRIPNERRPAQVIDLGDEETTDDLLIRAYDVALMGNPDPTKFDHAG
jgi:hypothetical protein